MAACVHHWRIDAPDGPTSEGECRRCGETRTFSNASVAFTPGQLPRAAMARRPRVLFVEGGRYRGE